MKLLAISGSARKASTNTALLNELARQAPDDIKIEVFADVATLPVFSPDRKGGRTPPEILALAAKIAQADGLIISSPEYIHAIPGGLKNAIDWMVSRTEIIGKPIVLIHASHGGEDVLRSLRLVLHTVSERFDEGNFVRFLLRSKTPEEIQALLTKPEAKLNILGFLEKFKSFIRAYAIGRTKPSRPSAIDQRSFASRWAGPRLRLGIIAVRRCKTRNGVVKMHAIRQPVQHPSHTCRARPRPYPYNRRGPSFP